MEKSFLQKLKIKNFLYKQTFKWSWALDDRSIGTGTVLTRACNAQCRIGRTEIFFELEPEQNRFSEQYTSSETRGKKPRLRPGNNLFSSKFHIQIQKYSYSIVIFITLMNISMSKEINFVNL